jgi:hypothetical protein
MSQLVGSNIDGTFGNQSNFVMRDSQGNIVETKPSKFGDIFKNDPNLFRDMVIGGSDFAPKPAFQQNNGEPYVFLKDFSFTESIKGAGSNTYNYKKDQVVYPFPSSPNVRMMPNPVFTKAINEGVLVPQKTAQQQAQMEIAKQQAVMQEMGAYNNRLTDKVFGKEGGWSFERPMRVGAYIVVGAVVGRYVAKNMGKSTTLGMVVGGLAPLLALKLTMEYDKKNMPKQEPRQKVALISDKEKISLFNDAIADYKGGVAPPQILLDSIKAKKEVANAKIKEFKLEKEFSIWLNSRPKVDYGMYPPPTMPNKSLQGQIMCIKAPC